MTDPVRSAAELASAWTVREAAYAANRYAGRLDGPAVTTRCGTRPLLLSAPHAVNHPRDGKSKMADRRTGGLAEVLADELGAYLLVLAGPLEHADEWAERTDDFRRALDTAADAGLLVVDIHGMSDSHGLDVCLGLGERASALSRDAADTLRSALERAGFTVAVGKPFPATAPHTVVSRVQAVGGHAVQVEIAARLRRPDADPGTAGRLVSVLRDALAAC